MRLGLLATLLVRGERVFAQISDTRMPDWDSGRSTTVSLAELAQGGVHGQQPSLAEYIERLEQQRAAADGLAGRYAENAGYPVQRGQVVPVATALLDALASHDRHPRQLSQLLQRQAAGQAEYPQRRPGRVGVVQNDRVNAEGSRQPRHVPGLRCVRAPLPVPDAVGRAHAGPLSKVFAGQPGGEPGLPQPVAREVPHRRIFASAVS